MAERQKQPAAEDDSEDDYMSDALLKSLEASQETETYSQRRKAALSMQEQRGRQKSARELELEKREEGLRTKIPETSVGFKLLAKMGYRKGETLGATREGGLLEPIKVTLRSDRAGLGAFGDDDEDPPDLQTHSKRKRTPEEEARLERQLDKQRQAFRAQMNERFSSRRIESDLKKARLACQTMDEQAGVPQHAFWPKVVAIQKEDANEDADEPNHEEVVVDDDASGDQSSADQDDFDNLEPLEQLRQTNNYLREKYNFCLWCGIVYANQDELSLECPGDTAQDHDEV